MFSARVLLLDLLLVQAQRAGYVAGDTHKALQPAELYAPNQPAKHGNTSHIIRVAAA
jgi:hypothetical protein